MNHMSDDFAIIDFETPLYDVFMVSVEHRLDLREFALQEPK